MGETSTPLIPILSTSARDSDVSATRYLDYKLGAPDCGGPWGRGSGLLTRLDEVDGVTRVGPGTGRGGNKKV